MSSELTPDEARVLHYVREKGIVQTGEVMRDLGLPERAANEALHVLHDMDLVQFTTQTGFIGSREELIIARVTGAGIRADDGRLAPHPPIVITLPGQAVVTRLSRNTRASKEARFMLRLAVWLVGLLVVIIVGSFFFYLLAGINSVSTYTPPIGQVMAFVFNVAELGGVACGAIFGFTVFLHQVPRVRERLDKIVEGRDRD